MSLRSSSSVRLALACSLAGCPSPDSTRVATPITKADASELGIEHRAKPSAPTAAYRWVDIMLEVTGREVDKVGARPTIISRQMAIPMTAMYDAWAAYDPKAVGTRLGAKLRRPIAEHTVANKEIAIAWAMYLTLLDLFPADAQWLAEQMRAMGQDPSDSTADPATPQGIGRAAAQAVLELRRNDGANQDGKDAGGNGQPYADTSGYQPKNTVDRVVDPDHWQPIPFDDGKGGTFVPGFLTPHWYRVKPFALERSDQFRPPPPPLVGSPELARDTDENIAMNGSLTLEQKAIVEFMRDGPRSTGQSGHWLQFAQDVSRRDHHDLDRDVKLFFAVANVAFDAFIAAWDAKRVYDSSRPWTLVRHYYGESEIVGYLGPCKGVGKIRGNAWYPYSPRTFVTPPFPGFPSGHSTVSAASSKILELFTGSDTFGAYYRHDAGMYTETGCSTAQMQAKDGTPDAKAPTSPTIVLRMPTFSATAEMAGISRVLGGYHIQADNSGGLELGRKVAEYSWKKYQAYFDGTASDAPSK
ncbi:MAG TPA: vanadium-dependent haloperoxidase [Nannocystaceae bacterium]|nr:vanadium-dependent haloperoxidase [Nannocystaceae bacterium]